MKTSTKINLAACFLCFAWSHLKVNAGTVEYPTSVVFLNAPPNQLEGRFELRQGKLYRESDGAFIPMDASISVPASLSQTDGVGKYILGAPAIVRETKNVNVPTSLEASGGTFAASETKDGVTLVHETRTPKPGELQTTVTTLTVFKVAGQDAEKLSSFSFKDNLYNQYLSEVWPIDVATLGIVTRSSRHSGIKTLFLFDLRERRLEGMLEFSRLHFIPNSKSLWFASSVPNCKNLDEMLNEARQAGRIIPLFESGMINKALKPMDDMDLDREQNTLHSNNTPQNTPVDATPTNPPQVTQPNAPKPVTQTTLLPQPESNSWLVWLFIVIAATGSAVWVFSRKSK